MKYVFKSSPDVHEIIVETSLPARYTLEQLPGVKSVLMLGGNTYSIVIEINIDRQQFLRHLTSALRAA